MDKQTIEKLQALLLAKKENLEKELSSFATKDPGVKHDWDSKYPRMPGSNLEEAADEVEQYSTNLPIEFSLEAQLKEVNIALEKIAKGAYGTCEKCAEQIPEERLLVSPESPFCASCA